MKRSPELAPLSRKHHRVLYAAMLLSRATEVEAVREEALDLWSEDVKDHFEIEEQVLLPGWLERDPKAGTDLAARMLSEHLELRVAFRRLERGDLEISEVNALGAALEGHVRFEERELFPLIEARLDADAIASLGAELEGFR